jgi:hypothetical protein
MLVPEFPVWILADVLSRQIIPTGWMLAIDDFTDAILALSLAEPRLTNTIEAKIPMIAITIKSSIRVKPFFFFLFFFFFILLLPSFIFYYFNLIMTIYMRR